MLEPVKVRLAADLHERTKRYAEQISATHSEALRRLIERGLDVSATDSYDLAKTLSALAAGVQQAADRLGSLESDTANLVGALPDMKGVVDLLGERSDAAQPQAPVFIKMLCEILTATRVLVNKADPEHFDKLEQFAGMQFEAYNATVQAQPGGQAYTPLPAPITQPRSKP